MVSGPSQPEQVGDALGVAGPALGVESLQLGLDLGEHLGVEQLAQLGPAEQLGEQALVEGERGGPALGDGGVALVDELRRRSRTAGCGRTATAGGCRRRGCRPRGAATRRISPTSAGRS